MTNMRSGSLLQIIQYKAYSKQQSRPERCRWVRSLAGSAVAMGEIAGQRFGSSNGHLKGARQPSTEMLIKKITTNNWERKKVQGGIPYMQVASRKAKQLNESRRHMRGAQQPYGQSTVVHIFSLFFCHHHQTRWRISLHYQICSATVSCFVCSTLIDLVFSCFS